MTASTAAFCGNCGERRDPASRYCGTCGADANGALQSNDGAGNGMHQHQSYQMPGANWAHSFGCPTCGGQGSNLPADRVYCPYCRWLRPLGPEYVLDESAFMWQLDAHAMGVLQSMGPLRDAAHAIAERFGRPWFEAAVNGLRLSEQQMPEIFNAAISAARIVGVPYLPEVYISGERMWDAVTMGSDSGAFIAVGSVLTNLKYDEMLFLLGREMGHVRAGHALWRTTIEFVGGQKKGQATIMGEGVMQFLNPFKIVESAIEAPLMAWARHSEITADRAGLIAVGKFDTAQRVLTQWTLKSFPLWTKINQEAWLEEENASDDPQMRASEMTMSSIPYLAPRLKGLRDFCATENFVGWQELIRHWKERDPHFAALARDEQKAAKKAEKKPAGKTPAEDMVKIVCVGCHEALRVKASALVGSKTVHIRCPNKACGKILAVKPRTPSAAPAQKPPPPDQLSD